MNTTSSSSITLKCTSKTTSYGASFNQRGGRRRCTVRAAAATTASRTTDYYKVLSLEHSADIGEEDVKRAYRRLALQYHPDVCPPSRRAESTELFVELRRAYETLSDPATRVQYDAELRTGTAARRAAHGLPWDAWEAQLCVLQARSERRQSARRHGDNPF
ncbi:hypothetical protein ACQ4PT_055674 [Festuca glaucescens]